MPENILQRSIKRLRPGSGGPTQAISIVDGPTSRSGDFSTGFKRATQTDEDFDDIKSGQPLALSNELSVASNILPAPVGLLAGVDPNDPDKRIPFHQPDDPQVLYRLFGLRGMSDE